MCTRLLAWMGVAGVGPGLIRGRVKNTNNNNKKSIAKHGYQNPVTWHRGDAEAGEQGPSLPAALNRLRAAPQVSPRRLRHARSLSCRRMSPTAVHALATHSGDVPGKRQ